MRRVTQGELERAAALASHRIKPGDWDALIEAMAEVFCAQEEKRIAATTEKPRKTTASAQARRPPAQVRREIWQRDGGCCAYVGPDGHRCGSRRRVQYHHVIPAGQGGPTTVENLELRCAVHNLYEAEKVYGSSFMNAKRKGTTPGRGDRGDGG